MLSSEERKEEKSWKIQGREGGLFQVTYLIMGNSHPQKRLVVGRPLHQVDGTRHHDEPLSPVVDHQVDHVPGCRYNWR